MRPELLWAPRAWLPGATGGAWHDRVLLRIGADGTWAGIDVGVHLPPDGAEVLSGPALPGLVDAHSHAFQRAFAGLAERLEPSGGAAGGDDFWSWRDRMYRVALRVTPEQLAAIATQLYIELLVGGYTHVCEFHYLRGAPDGRPYDDPVAMARALADAADTAGIGLTVLPVLYERAGFATPSLQPTQRRFACDAAQVWADHAAITADGRRLVRSGLAVHSLRAADMASIHRLLHLAADFDGPIHIHVSEQTGEVDECVRLTGQRPIERLAREALLDPRWQLVHATHASAAEIDDVARSGAAVVLCPSTEANLGDGLADLAGWLAAGVPLTVGSDSNVTRSWTEEVRWLEYGQRLHRQRRNVASLGSVSSAERLVDMAVSASGRAAGVARWGLQIGARADALVVDANAPAMLGIPSRQALDAVVFSSPGAAFRDVMVAGEWVVRDHRHARCAHAAAEFRSTMDVLWATG